MPEISERGGSERRGRRPVPLRDPSQNLVPEQKVNTLRKFENVLKKEYQISNELEFEIN